RGQSPRPAGARRARGPDLAAPAAGRCRAPARRDRPVAGPRSNRFSPAPLRLGRSEKGIRTMRWDVGRQGGDIEDRRGLGPVAIGGGLGGVGVVVAIVAYLL